MQSFPKFPEFKKLGLEDKNAFYEFTKRYPPYSDYNFVSLWSYDVEDDTLISILNGNLVIRLRGYISNEYTYSFLGNHQPLETIEELIGFMEGAGFPTELKLIPEINIVEHRSLIENNFIVSEDRDGFDYVFSLENINNLSGKNYSGKRNKTNRFIKDHPKAYSRHIDLKKRDNDEHILYIFSHWARDRKAEETAHEFKALRRLLKDASHLNLICIGVFINEKLEAFTIVEPLPDNFSIAHYSKADPQKVGIFEFLYKSMANELLKIGCLYYNREQDLGIEGLRAAKLSWRPIHFLKKYTISKKSAH